MGASLDVITTTLLATLQHSNASIQEKQKIILATFHQPILPISSPMNESFPFTSNISKPYTMTTWKNIPLTPHIACESQSVSPMAGCRVGMEGGRWWFMVQSYHTDQQFEHAQFINSCSVLIQSFPFPSPVEDG